MAVYRRLATRFHCTPDELADRLAATEAKLERIERDESDLLALERPLAEAWAALKLAAGKLTKARQKVAKDFARVIQATAQAARTRRPRLSGRGRNPTSSATTRSHGRSARIGGRPRRDALLGQSRRSSRGRSARSPPAASSRD